MNNINNMVKTFILFENCYIFNNILICRKIQYGNGGGVSKAQSRSYFGSVCIYGVSLLSLNLEG